MKFLVFHQNKVQDLLRESCMLTDKNIFKNKVIECRTHVCERRIIKQGYQTEVNFEGAGVKKGT